MIEKSIKLSNDHWDQINQLINDLDLIK